MESNVQSQPRHASKRLLLAVGGGILVTLLVAVAIFSRSKPQTVIEVDRTALESREGRLYLKGEDRPFTGVMTEQYPDGLVLSRTHVRDGVLHGLSQGFYTNRQVQVTENFEQGVSNGIREKWRQDGSKESEAVIVQGKLHGPFKRYHPNGEIAEEVRMVAGAPEGESKAFYPSGYLKAMARLENGKVLEQKFWKDGEIKSGGAQEARQ